MEFKRTSKWWQKKKPEVLGKTEFLKDPRNKNIHHFVSHHYYLENKQLIKLELFQLEILDGIYSKDGSRPWDLCLIGLPRKQGKTSLLRGVVLWELFFSPLPVSRGHFSDNIPIIGQKRRREKFRLRDLFGWLFRKK